MRRFAKTWIVLASLAVSAVASAQTAEWDRAWAFRGQLGLAPVDLAALAAPATVHDSLVAAVRDGLVLQPSADRAAIDAIGDESDRVSELISWGRDPVDAWAGLRAASAEAIAALAPLIEETQAALPSDLRGYVDRAVANIGLDSPYRLLDLSEPQRESIYMYQQDRDRVLRDARQRHRPERLEAAQTAFDAQLQGVLTVTHRAELAEFQANIAANLETVLDHELADYPEPPAAEDPENAEQQASSQQKVVPYERLGAVFENFRAGFRKWISLPAPANSGPPVAMAR